MLICVNPSSSSKRQTAEHLKSSKVSNDQKYCADRNKGVRKQIG